MIGTFQAIMCYNGLNQITGPRETKTHRASSLFGGLPGFVSQVGGDIKPDLSDLLSIAGTLLLGGGLWWIYPPAALIGLGVILLGMGLLLARRKAGS